MRGREIKIKIRIKIRSSFGGPEFVEEVGVSVWGADDAEFAGAGFEGIGEDGEDGAPDLVGMIVKGEFGEDEVGAVAADGFWFGGERGDAGAVREDYF